MMITALSYRRCMQIRNSEPSAMLLPVDGKTVIEIVIEKLKESRVEPSN